MDNLRVVLILVGIALIIGLVVHGLWTLQKNSRQGRASRESLQRKRQDYAGEQADLLDQPERDAGAQARDFDDLGIGKVKTRKRGEREYAPAAERVSDFNAESSVESPVKSMASANDSGQPDTEQVAPEKPATAAAQSDAEAMPAAIKAKDDSAPSDEVPSIRAHRDDAANEAEQLAIGLPDAHEGEEIPEPPKEEVITLYVSGDIKGQVLLQTVTELGMKFGELDIFHRYEQPSGRGPLLFRMANMYNPGTFDLDNLENFTARGVVLFMTLPLKYDGHKAFTMMYNAANKIAEAMPRAAVLDANRNPMTKQSVQHTYQKIREFERRQKIAGLRQQ